VRNFPLFHTSHITHSAQLISFAVLAGAVGGVSHSLDTFILPGSERTQKANKQANKLEVAFSRCHSSRDASAVPIRTAQS
jgi:hypothetical protein